MKTRHHPAVLLACLLAAGTCALPPAMACGDDSGLDGAAISAVHPRSLDVALAIHDALVAKRITALPPMAPEAGAARTGKLVLKTNQALGARGSKPMPPMALLLVEQHQWNRYIPATSGSQIASDVEGPQPDDVVLVTGEVVLNALLEGRLGWSEAVQRGLVVVTGEQRAVASVTATLGQSFDVPRA